MENLINEQLEDLKNTEKKEETNNLTFEDFLNDLNQNQNEIEQIEEIEQNEQNEQNETDEQNETNEENEQINENAEEYPLGYAFACVHESIIPVVSKYIIESVSDKTLDLKAFKLSAKQKKELAKAYEVIAKEVTQKQNPVLSATITILGITAGQILTSLKDKEKKQTNQEQNETNINTNKRKRGRPKKNET